MVKRIWWGSGLLSLALILLLALQWAWVNQAYQPNDNQLVDDDAVGGWRPTKLMATVMAASGTS